jgi:uncharacterized protein (UPF0332 family)
MTLKEEDREILIKYRLEQAKKTGKVVDLLIANNELSTAVNRIYYGMFYALLALALKYKFETSKHEQLIAWFNKNFIQAEKIETKYGKILSSAYKNRKRGDYEAFVAFDIEYVKLMKSEMIDFINEIEKTIMSN